MKQIRFYVDTPQEGCGYIEEIVDFASMTTDAEIDVEFKEWLADQFDCYWEEV